MKFDKLLFAAERGFLPKGVSKVVESASLFLLPFRYHQHFSPESLEYQELEEAIDQRCFLPLRPMAIEDRSSVVVLSDLEERASGLSPRRFFIDCYSLGANAQDEFQQHEIGQGQVISSVARDALSVAERERLRVEAPPDSNYLVAWGVIQNVVRSDPIHGSYSFTLDVNDAGAIVIDRENRKQPLRLPMGSAIGDDAIMSAVRNSARNAVTALREAAWFNTPNRWVVESRPLKIRPSKKGMLPRTDNRSLFKLLTVQEIRELFWKSSEFQQQYERGVTHRRRHPRTYVHPRYERSGLKDCTVWIDAHWQGPQNVKVGKWEHLVRLDL